MLIGFIITCEILFWVMVLCGLACRYLWKQKRLSSILLLLTPFVDLVLLTATVISLRGGAEATLAHALAAVYIGVSIGYGHRMISTADAWFAHRFAGGEKPRKKYGKEHAQHERTGWLFHALSWAIGCALLYGMVFLVGNEGKTETLAQTVRVWSIILAIDFIISFSYTIWPRNDNKKLGA
ncbi:hypothetical protein M3231_02135 [Neobacillus mesonae]|nr:hypothetical protein [Neobacillus mesonae]